MKKQNIIAEGHCGLTVTLNLMDQYAITHAVERMEQHQAQEAAHKEWYEKRKVERWDRKLSTEEARAWDAQNPEPTVDQWNWEEEMLPIYTFLKKLTLPKGSEATVFDPEEK